MVSEYEIYLELTEPHLKSAATHLTDLLCDIIPIYFAYENAGATRFIMCKMFPLVVQID